MPKRDQPTFRNEIVLDGVPVRLASNSSIFSSRMFAREWLEDERWRSRPVCPHCSVSKVYRIKSKRGFFRCGAPECRKDFSVTTGTIMERSHIPHQKWLVAFYLMATGYKVRVEDLRWALNLTYRSAWILWHRIYKVMPETSRQAVTGGRAIRTRPCQPEKPPTLAERIALAHASARLVPESRPVPPDPNDPIPADVLRARQLRLFRR